MSLTSALTVALSGLQTSSAVAQIIAGNVSNAQTPGYTAKTANLEAVITGGSSGGVQIGSYSRLADSVLSQTYNNTTASASFYGTQSNYLNQVQTILGSAQNNPALSSAVSNLQAAWQNFATQPESSVEQNAVIQAGQNFTNVVTSIATQLSTLQSQVTSDTQTTVTQLNSYLSQVQALNGEISTAEANHQSSTNLQDQRDNLVNQISSIVNVQTFSRTNDAIAIYTPQGANLLDGEAQSYSYTGGKVYDAAGNDVTSVLTGGKLQAQLNFQSTNASDNTVGTATITKLQTQLQSFVASFLSNSTTPASQFATAYDSAASDGTATQLSSSFFTASGAANSPDITTFAVNPSLLNGTKTVKQTVGTAVNSAFTAPQAFSSAGLNVTNQTYSQIAVSILSTYQQQANSLKSSSDTQSSQQTYYKNALSSESGVNIDTELVNLTNFQSSYAACAHVITTVQSMIKTLEDAVQ